MAHITLLVGSKMIRVLTGSCDSIVATGTVAGNGRMIEARWSPCQSAMTGAAFGIGLNVPQVFSACHRAIVTIRTGA